MSTPILKYISQISGPYIWIDPKTRRELLDRLREARRELRGITSLEKMNWNYCIAWRIIEASCRLQLDGYNVHVADKAADYAAEEAKKAVLSGKVWSQENRGGWFFACALNKAKHLAWWESGFDPACARLACLGLDLEKAIAMKSNLLNALKKLPTREHRKVVLRHIVGGESQKAVARKMKITWRRVKSLLEEALEQMHNDLLPAWTLQFEI